ncbi:LADA_0H06260g1_1 [Lachancea dasiensis]|uniref:LADA_0H06260g1_1 n=1 Tax=Lachancea dasiensis TaxID=1072105 RepID=A0A1G4K1K0_9SACH|nr:LADA_0H06260g1_1 [Lachancea dasiensis]
MSTLKRSPLKQTDSNIRAGTQAAVKRRSVEKLEIQHRKRVRTVEGGGRSRTIEGAVQHQHRKAEFKKVDEGNDEGEERQNVNDNKTSNNNITGAKSAKTGGGKVTPQDLLEWQTNWRRIMRRDTKIYFDTTEASHKNDKKRDLLKRGFMSLGARITPFFDTDVTIVVTQRVIREYSRLPETDVLARAMIREMKIWDYEKASRFLNNLDVDLEAQECKNPLPPSTLSNLLHNEKLYGPTDRDPRAKREDVHYFKYPHVYLYDLWQVWAPVVIAEWRPQELNNPDRLPYPRVKPGTFGRCPFVGDGHCDELSAKRIMKRYKRDNQNEKYALQLRILYQKSAEPLSYTFDEFKTTKPLILSHNYPNSHECHDKLMGVNTQSSEETRSNQSVESINSRVDADTTTANAIKPPVKTVWKTPAVANLPPMMMLSRQDTEDMGADDLCRKKPRIPQEIKASGVVQSNDGSAVQGNGLGPTRASVMNKNMRTLNRLVVDKKFHGATVSPANASIGSTKPDEGEHSVKSDAAKRPTTSAATVKTSTGTTATAVPTATPAAHHVKMTSGYCENCRVKYECLDEHIGSEKHQEFAHDDLNFEPIDALIERLAASRAFTNRF